MIFFFFYDHLPDDMYNEHAQSIMEKTFKIPLTVEVDEATVTENEDYSSLFFNWPILDEDPVVCNA